MSASNGSDRVTNKQLYDELSDLRRELPTRREVYLTLSAALVLGQIAARLDVGTLQPLLRPSGEAVARLLALL